MQCDCTQVCWLCGVTTQHPSLRRHETNWHLSSVCILDVAHRVTSSICETTHLCMKLKQSLSILTRNQRLNREIPLENMNNQNWESIGSIYPQSVPVFFFFFYRRNWEIKKNQCYNFHGKESRLTEKKGAQISWLHFQSRYFLIPSTRGAKILLYSMTLTRDSDL